MNEAFKSQLNADIKNVWFNNDEFCDFHLVDGVEMHVLFDKYELDKNDNSGTKVAQEGIYTDQLLIFVPCDEFGPKPRTGRTIILDAKRSYRVIDVMTEDGLYRMQLEAIRG